MSEAIVLTAYPLSRAFRSELERAIGVEPRYLHLAQLRRLPLHEFIRSIRPDGALRCFVPLEDAGSIAILPMLQAVATLSNARSIEVVGPDLERRQVSRWRTVPSLARLVVASVDGARATRASGKELDTLLGTPRLEASSAGRHILHVNPNMWFGLKAGGSVGHVAGVVNGFVEAGLDVDLASVGAAPLVRPDVLHHVLRVPDAFGLPLEVNYYRFQGLAADQLAGIVRRRGADVIYQRMSVANYVGAVLSRQVGLPLVLEYNGSEVWAARHWGHDLRYGDLALRAEEASLRHAHLVVTISEVLRDELLERGVPADRIVTYPNCVDPAVYDSSRFPATEQERLRLELGIAPDAVVATFVGTFGQWHGVDVLARTIRRLVVGDSEWLDRSRLHFVLVGDGLRMKDVQELVGGPRFAPYVTLTGLVPQADAPAYLAASDILLSPHVPNADGSRFFGSPTKLFEYMSMGRAIVASDLDQIGDVLRDGLRAATLPDGDGGHAERPPAVLTTPGDEEELERAIRFLTESPSWRKRLGAAARDEVLRRYTWRHHVEAILEAFAGTVRP